MDHVSVGAQELSTTRATIGASGLAAARANSLRIALAEPLLPVGHFVSTKTGDCGAEVGCSPRFAQSELAKGSLLPMKIVIPGGTGQIGAVLCRAFSDTNDEVVVLSRNQAPRSACRSVQWDGRTLCGWTQELEGADVVINLAGKSVNCRYGKRNRREIMESRVDSVRAIHRALQNAKRPPGVWLQAATATIYAHRFDAPNDEASGAIGGNEPKAPETWRFSIDVAKAWESAVNDSRRLPNTRIVILRSAMTMSPDRGGIFAHLLGLVRCGLGGRAGDGRQFVSWIHEYDFVRAVRFLIENEISGVVNVCSPNPLPNSEFMAELRRAWGTAIGVPSSNWMLEVGAFVLRTETELILKSRRVVPGRLLQHGFQFQFPHWRDAANELCARYRKS
jgi:uncharacterized protein